MSLSITLNVQCEVNVHVLVMSILYFKGSHTFNCFFLFLKIVFSDLGPYCLQNRLPSAVCNMSYCRYLSDCRSRGREFDPGPFLYFVNSRKRVDKVSYVATDNFYKQFEPRSGRTKCRA